MIVDDLADKAQTLGLETFRICEFRNGNYRSIELRAANRCCDVYSVSKSVTSLIIGMLVDEGLLRTEDTVTDVLRNESQVWPSGWEQVTLGDLLSHTTGYAGGTLDIDQKDFVLPSDDDFLHAALKEPLVYPHGTRMVYSDANYYLVSRMAEAVSGKRLGDLARERLFAPMKIYGTAWAECPHGHTMGATGLYISAEDMVKLGVLILQKGIWKGKRLISEKWLHTAVLKQAQPDDPDAGYGYGFWRRKGSEAIIANGMLGQLIAVFPSRSAVFAWQSCTEKPELEELTDFLFQSMQGDR